VSLLGDHEPVTPGRGSGPVQVVGHEVTEIRRGQDHVRQPKAAVEPTGDRMSVLAEQQAALRRVATLVARGASPSDVFSAVADELARVLHVVNAGLLRYEPDGSGFVVAVGYEPGITRMPVPGEHIPLAGDDVGALVFRTGRAARIDNHANVSGPEADRIRAEGIGSIVGVPVTVDGRLWGAAIVGSRGPDPLPPDTEARIGDFADLLAAAIAAASTRSELQSSRDNLGVLATQQSALRRVATLVARGVSPSEVFSAVAEEMAHCMHTGHAAVFRYEAEKVLVPLAICHQDGLQRLPKGLRLTLEADNVAATVLRTGRTVRVDKAEDAPGPHGGRVRGLGMHSAAGAPIVVDGRVWGVAVVGSVRPEPLPPDTEERIGDFADLLATAIANAATRADLLASRARIVAAADDARRRLERDLHDGAQQRLVSLGLLARAAEASIPPELRDQRRQLADIVAGLTDVLTDLQELSRGIHPAILSNGGLRPALKALARRSVVPVELDLTIDRRFADSVELATYYAIAEALTNAAKHSQASEVTLSARSDKDNLYVCIADNGIGGADFRKGSGLTGLTDRIEALGGHIAVASPAGAGTSLRFTIPVSTP
jgi:signal transduction histidine kinase